VTYAPTARTFALPGIIQVARAGDFESVLSFGVGVARAEPFRVFTMTMPSLVVIDLRTPYRTVPVRDYFLRAHGPMNGAAPSVQAVSRQVIPPATAFGADEIRPTLKQFPSVRWVKIYEQHGRTERPFGHSDSIPLSLEP
jgi:hypothetical protein